MMREPELLRRAAQLAVAFSIVVQGSTVPWLARRCELLEDDDAPPTPPIGAGG